MNQETSLGLKIREPFKQRLMGPMIKQVFPSPNMHQFAASQPGQEFSDSSRHMPVPLRDLPMISGLAYHSPVRMERRGCEAVFLTGPLGAFIRVKINQRSEIFCGDQLFLDP